MKSLQRFFQSIKKISPQKHMLISAVVLIICAAGSLGFGAADFSIMDWSGQKDVLLYLRLPRIIAAVFAGAGLAGAGVIIQTMLGNPLAGPNIIGVNAGAGFMTIIAALLFPVMPASQPLMAFAGALISVLLVYFLAKKSGASKMTILLAGVILNSLFNSATEALYTLYPHVLTNISDFRVGGFAAVQIKVLWFAIPMIIFAMILVGKNVRVLELLSLGDDVAFSLGVNVRRYRFVFLMSAACMAGATVSFAGLIGFLGLIVPHAARMITGDAASHLFPLSMLWGAILMVICDAFARTAFSPYELSVGIVLSIIGAPVFIWMLLHRKKR